MQEVHHFFILKHDVENNLVILGNVLRGEGQGEHLFRGVAIPRLLGHFADFHALHEGLDIVGNLGDLFLSKLRLAYLQRGQRLVQLFGAYICGFPHQLTQAGNGGGQLLVVKGDGILTQPVAEYVEAAVGVFPVHAEGILARQLQGKGVAALPGGKLVDAQRAEQVAHGGVDILAKGQIAGGEGNLRFQGQSCIQGFLHQFVGAFRQAGQRERQQHNRQERNKPFLHKIQSSYIWWSLPGYQALT